MKNLILIIIINLFLSFTWFGCSGSKSGNSKSNKNKPDTKETIVKAKNFIEPIPREIEWSLYEEGDYPEGFGGMAVFKDGGNNILSCPAAGKYSFQIDNPFPLDFRLVITMGGNSSNSKDYYVAITLMSPDGDLSYWVQPQPVGGGNWSLGFYNSKINNSIKMKNDILTDVELKKIGSVYKIYLANNFVCSYQNEEFYQFTGLRVSVTARDKSKKGFFFSKISLTTM